MPEQRDPAVTSKLEQILEILNEPPDSSAKLSDDYLTRRAMHHTALKEHLERLATNVSGDAEAEWSLIFVMDVLRKFLPLEQKWIDHNWKPGRRTEYDKDELHKMILRSAERLRKEDHKNLAAAVKADTNIEMSERHIRRIINGK